MRLTPANKPRARIAMSNDAHSEDVQASDSAEEPPEHKGINAGALSK